MLVSSITYGGKMKELIEQCIDTQIELNSLINPLWAREKLSWRLYAFIEGGELCDHLAPYHWKSNEPDFPQAYIEVIDIFHFLVSDYFMKSTDTIIDLTKARLINHLLNLCKEDHVMLDPEYWAVNTAPINYSFKDCFRMAKFFHKGVEEFFQMYLAKDVLNIFRQHHGYKNGTYVKVWSGLEDNLYLEKILKTFDFSLPRATERLYNELEQQFNLYAGVTKG